jgi:hypothetical protein
MDSLWASREGEATITTFETAQYAARICASTDREPLVLRYLLQAVGSSFEVLGLGKKLVEGLAASPSEHSEHIIIVPRAAQTASAALPLTA